MMVHRFSATGLSDLLVEMGQKRDKKRNWDLVKAENELANAFKPKFEDL